jgi:predicted nuclease of predicted toxin-antitoxin system
MKVLIDECAPKALKTFLLEHGHDCQTVQDEGWTGKQNGELQALAETSFQVFVTLDTSLRYQQNFKSTKLGIGLLVARTNRLADLRPLFARCAAAFQQSSPGKVDSIKSP